MKPKVLDVDDQGRLVQLRGLLRQAGGSGRYVSYRQAEADCRALALELRRHLGEAELETARFAAIPRGGLLVLGLLSYHLGLGSAQLGPAGKDSLLIVVDDCSLTGLRFRQVLAGCSPEQRVVFAHLYSHPALRSAIVEQEGGLEGRVEACLAARDLGDAPTSLNGDLPGREEWQRAWGERLGPERYWVGPTQALAFAWSEPDQPLWNPEAQSLEPGWCWTPPHRCLRNRIRLLAPEPADLEEGPWRPEWRLRSGVVYGDLDGVLWLCRSDSGDLHALRGVGADMGRWLLGYGAQEPVVRRLGREYQVAPEQASSDLGALVVDLEARGLIERCVLPDPDPEP